MRCHGLNGVLLDETDKLQLLYDSLALVRQAKMAFQECLPAMPLCNLIAAFPGYGLPVGDTDLRWRKVGVFVAVYREDAEKGEVVLLRLYYLSSNWRRHAIGTSRDADA